MQPASLKSVTFCSSASWLSSSEKSVAKPWDPQSFPKGGWGGVHTQKTNKRHPTSAKMLKSLGRPTNSISISHHFITSHHIQSLAVATAAPNHEHDTCSNKFSTEFGRSVTTVLPPKLGIVGGNGSPGSSHEIQLMSMVVSSSLNRW